MAAACGAAASALRASNRAVRASIAGASADAEAMGASGGGSEEVARRFIGAGTDVGDVEFLAEMSKEWNDGLLVGAF